MVANLSAHKRGWEDQIEFFSSMAEEGQIIKDKLLFLVDEDTAAFNKIIDAVRMPKSSPQEKKERTGALMDATKYAIEIPLQVMKTSSAAYSVLKQMTQKGNPNSITDAAVGALACRAAVHGAYLNVKINCVGLKDEEYVKKMLATAEKIWIKSESSCQAIMKIADKKIK